MPGKMSSWKEREIIKVTGDSQVTYKPVFTEDSKYLIVPCGQNVLIYSVKTGQLALTLKHHNDIVTHIELGPSKSMKLLSSSLDGCIGIWDYTDGALLKSFNCGIPIYCFKLQPTDADNPLLVMVVQNEQDSSLSAVLTIPSQFVMTNKSLGVAFNEVATSILHCVSFRQILFTYDGRYIVSYSKQKLHLYHFDKEQIFQYSMKSVITAVACHPAKHCIATGNTMGEIHLWYNYGRKDKSFVTRTKLHWHAHSVNDLCFTSDGVYLASGGEEGVLVYWQLATDHKHFRPRLGAPLMNLACSNDDNMFAVCLLNNTIMLISGLDNEVWTELVTLYKALPGMGYKANVSTGLVYNRHYKSIVLNSLPGCLQFYDFTRNKVKAQMEIVQLNYVSRPDDDVLSPTTVDIVAFSSCGKYLATIDSWECKGLSSETKLKFWKFDSNENKYTLTTVCDPPHQSHVTGLVFRPSSLKEEFSYNDDSEMPYSDMYVVTTGMDGYFKVWCTSMTTHKKKKKLTWNCKSATSYLDQPCYGCKFSSDGSLVAANFNKFITLWDFWSLELKHVFNSFTGDAFTNVLFGCGEASYYLMASSGHRFYVWNLLTLHIELVLSLTIDFMVNDPSSDAVALFTSKTNKLNGTSSNCNINDLHVCLI
jgi:NET1-associated nuclear protein 1 (U3 small nucleolar RNA-associated protein 17)